MGNFTNRSFLRWRHTGHLGGNFKKSLKKLLKKYRQNFEGKLTEFLEETMKI